MFTLFMDGPQRKDVCAKRKRRKRKDQKKALVFKDASLFFSHNIIQSLQKINREKRILYLLVKIDETPLYLF